MKKRTNPILLIGVLLCIALSEFSRWVYRVPDAVFLPVMILGIVLIGIGIHQIKNENNGNKG